MKGAAALDLSALLSPGGLATPPPLSAEERFLTNLASGLREMAHVEGETGGRPMFRSLIERVNPTLLNYEHIPKVVNVLQRFADGELTNVMILEPPRYFKTEVASRLFPAYLHHRFPGTMVGLSSYGADLAWSISEEARDYYVSAGGHLKKDTTAKRFWRTMSDGQMWASGATGPIHGFGYYWGIVDDPQDPEKAWSLTYQKRFEAWWERKWIQRAMPGARQLMVMQRLGPNDAIDYLFRREVGEDTDAAPMSWHVVLLDEIRSDAKVGRWDGPLGLPPTCTLEPDERPMGAVLAPSWFSEKEVKFKHTLTGPFTAATQRQQRPSVPEGDFWKLDWFKDMVYDELPEDAYNLGWDWDLAYTKDERNSASAGVKSARGPGNPDECLIYIEDVAWDWLEFPELINFIKARSGPHYIEAKASGKSAKQTLAREGIAAKEVTVLGDKLARASSVQNVAATKRIRVKRSVLRILLQGDRQGLLSVRAEDLAMGKGDLDLNDAFVEALTRHVGKQKGRSVRAAIPGLTNRQGTNGSDPLRRVGASGKLNGNGNGSARVTSRTVISLGETD